MMVEIDCPCGSSFEVAEDEITAEIECPACHELITVSADDPEDDSVVEDAWQVETGKDARSLIHEIGAALRYPLEGSGPYVLLSGWVIGTILFWACAFAYILGLIGLFVLASYLLTFLEAVALEAAGGGKRVPHWPDANEFLSDLLGPIWRFVVVVGAAGLPYLVVMGTLELTGVQWWLDPVLDHFLHDGLVLLWVFVAPIAYLTGILLGPWHAFNYAHILRSIARTAPSYMLCFLVVLFLTCVGLPVAILVAWLIIPYIGFLVFTLPFLYFAVVLARLFGVYYYVSRWRLDWLRCR